MRIRRPVLAAAALGLTSAILPASAAAAAAPDRRFSYAEAFKVQRPDGSSYDCQLTV